ncbi:hypothetical protein CJ178_29200 [Rhodococcus sp. ACPA4]|nr:hypothetical protein CJ178_29200 [Rhodococcus sp. ACPA4]
MDGTHHAIAVRQKLSPIRIGKCQKIAVQRLIDCHFLRLVAKAEIHRRTRGNNTCHFLPHKREVPMHDTTSISHTFDAIALKEMDPALLALAVLEAAERASISVEALQQAMNVAALAHIDQNRKNGIKNPEDPYIVHPLRNVLRLLRYGCVDADVLAATALHDTVEDQPRAVIELLSGHPTSEEDKSLLQQLASQAISNTFGSRVANIVAAVTNPINDSQDGNTVSYQDHVVAAIEDPAVFLVKFSDFVDNAGSVKHLGEPTRTRLSAKYAPLVRYFRTGASTLGNQLNLPQSGLDDITHHLDELEARLPVESSDPREPESTSTAT